MITVRRGNERHHDSSRKQESWHTFHAANRGDALAGGFGTLELFDEDRLRPGAGVPRHPHRDAEVLTYVREGTLAHEDSLGLSGVIYAGEFQRMTAGTGVRRSETNVSRSDWAHFFQICLRPSETGLQPAHEGKRFSSAERRGVLCVVASPDGRKGSLRVHQDAFLYSAMLDAGQHVVHELAPGRCAWLHLVTGEALLRDVFLSAGDGVGFTAERAVSLTARATTELLLLDLGPEPTPPPSNGDVT